MPKHSKGLFLWFLLIVLAIVFVHRLSEGGRSLVKTGDPLGQRVSRIKPKSTSGGPQEATWVNKIYLDRIDPRYVKSCNDLIKKPTFQLLEEINAFEQLKDPSTDEFEKYGALLEALATKEPELALGKIIRGIRCPVWNISERVIARILDGLGPENFLKSPSALLLLDKSANGGSFFAARSALMSVVSTAPDDPIYRDLISRIMSCADASNNVDTLINAKLMSDGSNLQDIISNYHLPEALISRATIAAARHFSDTDPEKAVEILSQIDVASVGLAYGTIIARTVEKDKQRALFLIDKLNSAQIGSVILNNELISGLELGKDFAIADAIFNKATLTASNLEPMKCLASLLFLQDPVKCVNQVLEFPASSARSDMIAGLYSTKTMTSSNEVFGFIGKLPQEAQIDALKGVIKNAGPELADELIKSVPANDRPGLIAIHLSTMAQSSPKDAAMQLSKDFSSGNLTVENSSSATSFIANSFANNDLDAARKWLEDLDPGLKPLAIGGIMNVWMRSDPISASAWAAKLPSGAAREAAIQVVVRETEATDPAAADEWKKLLKTNQNDNR